jgi:hypothetical protein
VSTWSISPLPPLPPIPNAEFVTVKKTPLRLRVWGVTQDSINASSELPELTEAEKERYTSWWGRFRSSSSVSNASTVLDPDPPLPPAPVATPARGSAKLPNVTELDEEEPTPVLAADFHLEVAGYLDAVSAAATGDPTAQSQADRLPKPTAESEEDQLRLLDAGDPTAQSQADRLPEPPAQSEEDRLRLLAAVSAAATGPAQSEEDRLSLLAELLVKLQLPASEPQPEAPATPATVAEPHACPAQGAPVPPPPAASEPQPQALEKDPSAQGAPVPPQAAAPEPQPQALEKEKDLSAQGAPVPPPPSKAIGLPPPPSRVPNSSRNPVEWKQFERFCKANPGCVEIQKAWTPGAYVARLDAV